MNMRIKKLGELYYQVVKVGSMYGYHIYDKYGKDREVMEMHEELVDTPEEAESNARDAISYHYD
jgi:hypothetical protein